MSMGQLITCLVFNGNCREAMEFYQSCLGGELYFQTLSESPKTGKLPNHFKEYVVWASLQRENLVLIGTDLTDEDLMPGNSISLLLNCSDEGRLRAFYENLGVGGKSTHPVQMTHWGDLFGGLTDRYGNRWMFQCRSKNGSEEPGTNKDGRSKIQNGG